MAGGWQIDPHRLKKNTITNKEEAKESVILYILNRHVMKDYSIVDVVLILTPATTIQPILRAYVNTA